MRLTGRQRQFLIRFVELYEREQQALHYSELGTQLGVSPVTAYDMLRVLEERGLARSEYVLPEGSSGRSSVVFSPTPAAATALAEGSERDDLSWEVLRAHVLEALKAGNPGRGQEMLKELLARLPEQESPMVYATNMVAATVLTLHQVQDHTTLQAVVARLHELGLPGELGLSALAGLLLGASLADRASLPISTLLLNQLARYQQTLSTLSARNKRRLSQFAQELLRVLEMV